ncbi:hypothetical protein JD844_016021 [Phrynosoma platyrhinos]|uniref:Ribosomal biogenesis factor n=1 Tax=Phrynosoma platyrhinos TaxID=52577 RepID=A0ABQ7SJT4_PHRPL|nr:hypothetical protein JD844_016021 [Phrynosoma platyrhinos]
MGKNKVKNKKQNVFHVANRKITKAKSKAKPVTTSLKKINIVNDEKVNTVNKVFMEVQKEVNQLSKAILSGSSKTSEVTKLCLLVKLENRKIPKALEAEPANVDAAANLLSQL